MFTFTGTPTVHMHQPNNRPQNTSVLFSLDILTARGLKKCQVSRLFISQEQRGTRMEKYRSDQFNFCNYLTKTYLFALIEIYKRAGYKKVCVNDKFDRLA